MADKKEKWVMDVFAELSRAEKLHPKWPTNRYVQLAIVAEELGEANQAALDMQFKNGTFKHYREELVQFCAMTLRILLNEYMDREQTIKYVFSLVKSFKLPANDRFKQLAMFGSALGAAQLSLCNLWDIRIYRQNLKVLAVAALKGLSKTSNAPRKK